MSSSNRGGTIYAGNGRDTVFTGILGLNGNSNAVSSSGLGSNTKDYVVYTGEAPVLGDTLGTETVGGDSVFLAAGADTVYVSELDAGVVLSAR